MSIGLTGALEDYLETIFQLVQEQPVARVRDIARARDVRAASVTPALRRLAALGLVDYQQREYVTLTERGAEEARRVFARHTLLTRFFEEILHMPADLAERDACAMEHGLSGEGMDRLARFFEFLAACTSGHHQLLARFHTCARIHGVGEPCAHCALDVNRPARHEDVDAVSLASVGRGGAGRVAQVRAQGALRQRLLDMGLIPGAEVRLERVAAGGAQVWVRLHGALLALTSEEAAAVRIVELSPTAPGAAGLG